MSPARAALNRVFLPYLRQISVIMTLLHTLPEEKRFEWWFTGYQGGIACGVRTLFRIRAKQRFRHLLYRRCDYR